MKYKLLLSTILFLSFPDLAAQNNTVFNLHKGDSIKVEVDAYGSLQWEQSTDNIHWEELPGKTQPSQYFVAYKNGYFRARVMEWNCDPVYSTTTYIRVMEECLNKTTLGAIRWDAGWVGNVSPISTYTQKQLSPEKFRFRTPFFASIHKPDSISFTYTQAVIDAEIAHAKNAGIDYWLYNWYPDGSGFDIPLDLHLTSPHKDDVKFSYIFYSTNWPLVKNEMSFTMKRMKESNYMKIDGIPLVFCMHDTWTLADIDELKSEAKKAEFLELYLVIMEWTGVEANQKCNYFGAQATSSYCNWGDGGISYSSFASATEQKWDTYKDPQNAFIPFVTTGWDPRPIIEYYHGLSKEDSISISTWYPKPAEDHYVQTATIDEVAMHLKAGLDWVKNNPAYATPNTVIIYAWNECSEGAFIVPVAEGDSTVINHGSKRLDAIKAILDTY